MWHGALVLPAILLVSLISFFLLFFYQCLRRQQGNQAAQLCILIAFILSLSSPWLLPLNSQLAWQIPIISNIKLAIILHYDTLTWVMLCLVSFVSLIIHSYAARYLLSDNNQARFMGQLSFLTFSVMLLMMSGNLLTAFVAWQFIGLSLYLLLNHYHYDYKANKSAKKKFMINRVGDLCFLLAVIITTIKYGNSEFATLFKHAHENNTLILSLIFVAIMTKSAQFPFHIWLIDTMEAPTPVSALMHAGVINAGGFLLARLSLLYDSDPNLLLIVFLIGLITALLGNFFMSYQSDVKKQLAYSTMGQMGYMVMQCGLGCFGSAVFHLIAHGFFKATSFLSFGNSLQTNNKPEIIDHSTQQKIIRWSLCLIITAVLIACGYNYLSLMHIEVPLNPLLWLFIAITVYQLLNKSLSKRLPLLIKITYVIMVSVIFFFYLILLKHFNLLLGNSVAEIQLTTIGWLTILTMLIITLLCVSVYCLLPPHQTNALLTRVFAIGFFKCGIEAFYRKRLINPIRKLGDTLINAYEKLPRYTQKIGLLALIAWLVITLLYYILTIHSFSWLTYTPVVAINLFIFIVLLIIANRVPRLSQLTVVLTLAMVCSSSLALACQEDSITVIGLFQLINSLIVMLGFYLLSTRSSRQGDHRFTHNRLPWSHFYMSIFLTLLIGIPGTASFIGEVYLLHGLLHLNIFYAGVFAIAILLLALAVLHTLQVHFFNPQAIAKYASPMPPTIHILCVFFIAFNIFNGIHPHSLLKLLLVITA